MDVNVPLVIVTSLISTVFAGGVFYATTNQRIKNLEQKQITESDTRERLIAIETKIELLLKRQ